MQNHSLLSVCGRLQPRLKTYLLWPVIFVSLLSKAQFPYSETFKNTSATNLVISGSAKLTAAAGIDPAGDGYLRLTENANYNVGYVYGIDSFASNYGITASFEFFSHKPGANSTNQADGMTFFLFDASVNAFRPGGAGGSLGYAQYYATPGMAKGYIGISIDAFGNFSSASDGTKNGGPGQRRSSVAIRGPGNGRGTSDYVYQTGVTTTDAPYNVGFNGFSQRYPDSTNANYRRIKIIMTPGSSLGPALGYKITILLYKGGVSVTPVTLISNFDYPFVAPARLQYGLAASTGSISNYHEIRNLTIEATNTSVLLPPVLSNDIGLSACYGQTAIIDVTSNDVSANAGGFINKTTIDLDPSTAGIQKTYTDVGKGSYSVDSNGIVSFLPQTGFVGASTVAYKVNDTYGITANASATLTFNVSNASAPLLTLSSPLPVCFPGMVNLTSPLYKNAPAGSAAAIVAPSSPTATFTGLSKVGDYTLRWTIANGSYSNYDEMSLRVTNVLPVTWLSFEAKDNDDKVTLDWQTGTEINNDHFNVERSINGVHFSVVGKVVASNKPQGDHYRYVDHIRGLASETVFYRIVQVDKDLTYSYSRILSVNREQKAKVSIWPNPICDVLTLSVVTAVDDQVRIALFDHQGRQLLLKDELMTRGKNTVSIKGVGALSKGVYYVRVSGKNIEIVSKVLKN